MGKKQKAIGCAVLTLSMVATACGSTTETTQTTVEESVETEQLESGTIPLTLWAETDSFPLLEKMIASFQQEYAGQATFEISLVEQSDAETKNVMLGDVHHAADVFSLPDDQLPSMIAAGALSPVANPEEVRSANLEEAVNASSHNGVLYAYPYTADNGYFLYYDKDYLSETDVQTMDQILAVAEQEGKKLSMEFNSGWYIYSFFGGTGLEFGLNDDGVTNYCNWNTTEGAITGVDVAEALLQITTHAGFVAQPDGDFIECVKDGSAIAGISGVWNAVTIKEAWGDDYGACKLPTYTCAGQQIQMSSFTGYKMMGVNAYSEHVEWAHKLADWITNEQNQTLRFEERNQGPSNINAAASDAVGQVPAIQAVIEQSQYGQLQRVGNKYWDACTNFANVMIAGNPEQKPLQEIMDTLVAGITASTAQ